MGQLQTLDGQPLSWDELHRRNAEYWALPEADTSGTLRTTAGGVGQAVRYALAQAGWRDAMDHTGRNLSGADLSGANLSGANLSEADLSGANLNGADLSRVNLSGIEME